MAFKDVMRGIGELILNNKLVTFLSVALFAFIITTIVLATENNSNKDALADCQAQLSATTAPPIPPTTTLQPGPDTTTLESEATTVVTTPTLLQRMLTAESNTNRIDRKR
ncbi:uncharacterized protein LOC129762621 isoform X2 [Toxorhynchites rutilus septentrionalis]|uniref:uncharacterized protein LOC129762621 isoform X2 n=1 Tax=Toxorhynchites rutilus septentrionalis TaxID=329112 RepID=UPI002478A24D|nr:uncharacterized protein LOC129762621 isoform X2 [Toxorhynchites rutilus septentrionalis]